MPDPDLLRRAGEALWPHLGWRNDLGEVLDVNERVLRRWLAGSAPIPPGVWGEVSGLLRERVRELTDLIRELEDGPC